MQGSPLDGRKLYAEAKAILTVKIPLVLSHKLRSFCYRYSLDINDVFKTAIEMYLKQFEEKS